MADTTYSYEGTAVTADSIDRLELEIAQSAIITALRTINLNGTSLDIVFKDTLSAGDETALDSLVNSHTGEPLAPESTMVDLVLPKDLDGRLYTKGVITEPEWHYAPRSLDFWTSKYNSLYNRSHYCGASGNDATIDGSVDLGDARMRFYDATNTELTKGAEELAEDFQIRLTANCVKTDIEFEPHWDYDVIGAKLQIRNPPADRAYFWFVAAPDIPKEYGGNVVFMGGGMNLHFFSESETFYCDGKTTSRVTYDEDYHSGKLVIIVKHAVGVQIGIQLILQFYSGE
jgi:hypothetical protein